MLFSTRPAVGSTHFGPECYVARPGRPHHPTRPAGPVTRLWPISPETGRETGIAPYSRHFRQMWHWPPTERRYVPPPIARPRPAHGRRGENRKRPAEGPRPGWGNPGGRPAGRQGGC